MAAVLLAACSNDSNELVPDTPEQAEEEKGLAMDLSASAPDFVNAAEPEEMARETLRGTSEAITRSWTPPSGYFLYSEFNDDHGICAGTELHGKRSAAQQHVYRG